MACPKPLPFEPLTITQAAQEFWLGIEVGEDGPDVDVVGYATDGRPEPKVDTPPPRRTVAEVATTSVAKLGLNDYDDYEEHDLEPESTGEEIVRTAKHLGELVRRYAVSTSRSLWERWRS